MADGDLGFIPWDERDGLSLGRHIRHDPQSRRFAAPMHVPPDRDVRHRNWGRKLYQNGVGACTGFAAAHALNTMPLRARRRPHKTLTNADAFTIYGLATTLDPWNGSYPLDDTGSSGLAACKALVELGLIASYEHAFGFNHGLSTIATAPWMQGTWWTDAMFRPDRDGRMHPTGGDVGGHEYLWHGVEIRSKLTPSQNRSWFLNSWHTPQRPWGKAGYAYLTWNDHEALLARQGDLIRPR